MDLVIASNNQHKIREIREILGDKFVLYTMADKGIDIEIEETGDTFEANALIKAKTVCDMTGAVALADDSGLCVDYLDGAPGVYSARYAGEQHDDKDNRAKLLSVMEGVPYDKRTACFRTVVVLYYPDGHYLVGQGKVQGHIMTEEHGNGGFGYDTLFFSDELGECFGECLPEKKNSVSHRSRALWDLVEQL